MALPPATPRARGPRSAIADYPAVLNAVNAVNAVNVITQHARRRRPGSPAALFGLACILMAATFLPAPVRAQGQPVAVESLDRQRDQNVLLPSTWWPASTAAPAPAPALASALASAPAPALVLMHGCGGLFDGRHRLAARYTEMAGRLNAMGIHVLVTDSLTPRGEKELCTQRSGERRVTQLQRRRDALGALQWLARQPGVDPQRLGLLGWSNGGSTVLAATNLNHPEVARAPQQPSLAVAFYPGCAAELQRAYRPAVPLLMLVGEADDWTPAADCKALATAALPTPGVAAPELEAYAGAHHGFDGAAPVRLRREVPGGANPGLGVHQGGQPEARAASALRLEKFLRQHWKLAS